MVNFVFENTRFNKPVYNKDMSIEPFEIEFEDGKKWIVSYTFKVQEGDILYIYNFSPLECEYKIVSNGKLIFSQDLSDQWSVYHVRHAVRLNKLEHLITSGIREIENLYKMSSGEIELLRLENEHKKMTELLDIIQDRQFNGGKKLIAQLAKKILKYNKDEKIENPYLVDTDNTEDQTEEYKGFNWDKKDFGM